VQGVPTDESNDLLPVDVRRVLDERPGVYPIGSLFQYPLDEINFPESWAWSLTQNYSNPIDRFEQVFQFTPGVGEECVYVMCFEGFLRAGDYGTTQPLTVEQVTTVRCNKVEVYNDVFEWTGEDEGISIQTVVHKPPAADGLFFSTWVYPSCKAEVSTCFPTSHKSFDDYHCQVTAWNTNFILLWHSWVHMLVCQIQRSKQNDNQGM